MATLTSSRETQSEMRELALSLKADGVTGIIREEPCGCTTFEGDVAKIGHVCCRYEPRYESCCCAPLNGEDVGKICPFHGQFLIDKILSAVKTAEPALIAA